MNRQSSDEVSTREEAGGITCDEGRKRPDDGDEACEDDRLTPMLQIEGLSLFYVFLQEQADIVSQNYIHTSLHTCISQVCAAAFTVNRNGESGGETLGYAD